MNLIDAIKTGRRIRSKTMQYWSEWENLSLYDFNNQQILCDDWEVEPEPKKDITEEIKISPQVVDAVVAFAAFIDKLLKIDEDE